MKRRRKRAKRMSRKLVQGHLERVSSEVFSEYPKTVTELASKRHGVYALYKGGRLYYVGLATNLRNRVRTHLRDRHKGKWDKFSLYLVRKADHIKELESIILRIVDPAGNATKGRLGHAENLKKKLGGKIRSIQDAERFDLLGHGFGQRAKRRSRAQRTRRRPSKRRKESVLAPFVRRRFTIRAKYKGKTYTAKVRKNGMINFRGTLYSSPSMAASALIDAGAANGWLFWRFKARDGAWKELRELRKKKAR